MKKLAFVLALTTTALATVCMIQSRRLARQETELASLKTQIAQGSTQLEAAQSAESRAAEEVQNLLRQSQELSAQVLAQRQATEQAQATVAALTNTPPPTAESARPDAGKGGFGNFLSKLLQDPESKKFIRDQQRMMMDQMYGPLIKQMGLSPEEAARFKDLIADNAMKSTEKASSLFGGLGSTNRAEALAGIKAAQQTFDDDLKTFLGDSRYALYKDYQQTVGERTQLNQFRQQNASSENPLTDLQAEQLLVIMKEEKQNVAGAAGLPNAGTGQDTANLEAMLSGGQLDKFLQAQETANQRVYQRASEVLAPDQLANFATFQTNQLQMMRMGMSMARKLFGADQSGSDSGR